MRPRRYGTLNRSIAKATSHAVNQAFRSNSRKNKYNNTYNNQNNTVKMPAVRSKEYNDTMVGIGIILLVGFVVLPFVVPGILWFYLLVCIMFALVK